MANSGAESSNREWVEGVGNSCAACKHWEKRCIEGECEFAPHFPADRMEDFVAVQRVFEMSNVSKMLKGTDQIRGGEKAKSLIWEANCWKDDPVHGPLGHHRDHVRHLENQISDKDQKIQQLTAIVTRLQQLAIRTDSNVGLRPHHRNDRLQSHGAPMLFQENAMFQGGYNVPWGGWTFPPATAYDQNPVIVQENATFQAGGYMPPPPHHLLQVDYRAPMLFQGNDTFQGGYNVASSSTFPPATVYNSYGYILPREDGGITVGGEAQYRAFLQRRRREGDDGRQH